MSSGASAACAQRHVAEQSGGGGRWLTEPSQRRLVLVAICALGVSSIITQLVLMRELLCIFSGNELVLGRLGGIQGRVPTFGSSNATGRHDNPPSTEW